MSRTEGPSLERLYSIHTDGSRNTIHPADVKGRFLRSRYALWVVLIAIYVGLPLVHVNGHPAVQLDIAARRFYLFGATFNAQDTWIVVFLLTTFGFGLFVATAWLGRVWCGYACPQTVFLDGVYRKIERLVDGPRQARLSLDAAPYGLGKLARRVVKHGLYLLVSLALAHVFISFFVSASDLWRMMQRDPRESWPAFLWVLAVTAALQFNFAWFREQLCIIVCPYGRLQSALQDRHSIGPNYDARRGEPRGKLTRAAREGKEAAVGDCVDCMRCVHVCPTGIDIRNGMQLECIACAQCIDACDEVMDKVGRPRGLIRYDSLEGLAGKARKILRPRLAIYTAMFGVSATALVLSLVLRTPFEANLLRVRGTPWIEEAGVVRNQFELHLVNKAPEPATFRVEPKAHAGAKFTLPMTEVKLEPLAGYRLPIFVEVPSADVHGPFDLGVRVTSDAADDPKEVRARFLAPVR